MAQFFYDGQIRRYLTQVMRILSNFYVSDGDNDLRSVPVMYGDLNRQVAHILKENSENKLPSAPRISVYITDLQMDRSRSSDSSFVNSLNVRERAYDDVTGNYTTEQGKNYTVERLMPTPYTMTVNADIWTTNTDQKLQLLEQILVWFNPSLEIQTSDSIIDWTSVTVINLENIQYSSRSIPVGTESEMDIVTLSFSLPIFVNPPAKVKRMGIITNIISSVFNEELGTIESGVSQPALNRYNDSAIPGVKDVNNNRITVTSETDKIVAANYDQYGVYLDGDKAQLISGGVIGKVNWHEVLERHPGNYIPGVGVIYLTNLSSDVTVVGNITLDVTDNSVLNIDWDTDTFPQDTIIPGPGGNRTTIDYIIDPTKENPINLKTPGTRIMILENIGDSSNTSGPSAWKNSDNSDFIAEQYDIVEWDGSDWHIVFDASEETGTIYTTNLYTQQQYRYDGVEWLLSVDGEYTPGSWRINLYG